MLSKSRLSNKRHKKEMKRRAKRRLIVHYWAQYNDYQRAVRG